MTILSRPKETLEEHIERVTNSYTNLCERKGIDKIIDNVINLLLKEEELEEYKAIVSQMVLDTIILHDVGKKNKYFQAYVENPEYKDIEYSDSDKEHSLISSYYYLEKYNEDIKALNLKGTAGRSSTKKLKELAVIFSYIISRHHGSLGNFNKGKYLDSIKDKSERAPGAFFDGYNTSAIKNYEKYVFTFEGKTIYFLSRYLYSILVTCDFMAVYECYQGKQLKLNIIDGEIRKRFTDKLKEVDIVKSIRKYQDGGILNGVNKFRSDMFLESELNIKNMGNKMFYLEAPTGCGKSLTGLNLTLNMVNATYNKVIYVAPFTNIIEQSYKDICEFIGTNKKDIVNINAKEEIATSDEDDLFTNFEIDVMDNLLVNYPYSVISHVRLFDMLFGNKRKQMMMTTLLANSVIVLDEIQSYKNKLWIPIINFLKEYAELLNIKIIIMSATLPKMDVLIDDENYKIANLINDKKYYYDFFKTRVDFNFGLLENISGNREEDKEALLNKIDEVAAIGKRILIGTITIKTCNDIYKKMVDRYGNKGYEVYKIQGTTNVANKNRMIAAIKEKDADKSYKLKKVILVATQCVEAGVDIDMEIGFKNIATLDSDEQFCGRIQRNFIGKGVVYFFKLDDVGKIYIDDYRAEKTLESIEWREILESKNFDKFYERAYEWLIDKEYYNYVTIKNYARKLQFETISTEMKLIEDDGKVNLLMICKYKDPDGKIIDIEDELNKYKDIKSSCKNYSEKQVLLSRFRKVFDKFSFVVNKWDAEKIDCNEEFGNYKLIQGAEFCFTNVDEEDCITDKSEFDLEKLLSEAMFY